MQVGQAGAAGLAAARCARGSRRAGRPRRAPAGRSPRRPRRRTRSASCARGTPAPGRASRTVETDVTAVGHDPTMIMKLNFNFKSAVGPAAPALRAGRGARPQSDHARGARRHLSLLRRAPEGRSGDGRRGLGGQEEGAGEELRRPRVARRTPRRTCSRRSSRARWRRRGTRRTSWRRSSRRHASAPPPIPPAGLRTRSTTNSVRAGALLVIGLWIGLLVASWAMASASFRTVDRLLGPEARPELQARLGARLRDDRRTGPAARGRGSEPLDVPDLGA